MMDTWLNDVGGYHWIHYKIIIFALTFQLVMMTKYIWDYV